MCSFQKAKFMRNIIFYLYFILRSHLKINAFGLHAKRMRFAQSFEYMRRG